ncbi:sensor histidine kinase [Limnoglobus roseus]|uniref:histidine kinase n=1 Tax=Limnoglobus roseus TaxID=2598579 RepID=A0A5C1AJD7_9BACT|nr:ATP-binding protein [Limnoglobus roseus]QEL19579.1 histidine kinase [Limnoglobus roseus]
MDRRIAPRLLLPITVVSVLLLATAVGAAWYIRGIQQSLAASLTENVVSVVAAQELEGHIREVDAALDRFLITGDRAHLEAIPRLQRETADALRTAEEWALTDQEQALMRRVRLGHDRLFGELSRAGRDGPADQLRGRIAQLAELPEREILEPAREYRRVNEEVLTETSRETARLADSLTVGLVVLGLCGAAGGLLGGWAVTTGIRRSIEQTDDRLRHTAARLEAVVPSPVAPPAEDAAEWVDKSVSAVLERLEQTERNALRAEQLAWVGQMAAGIAHEVRNPLAAIKIIVQTAADPLRRAPFGSRDLTVLEQEITRLEQIVSGFLDFARPPQPDKQRFDVRVLLEQTVDTIRARANLQRVTLEIDAPPEAVCVCADPNQLRQLVYNLLYNALDAQPKGGQVRVAVATPDPGSEVVLRIEDEGNGLPAGLGDRIFEPFVSTKAAGMGLGLSICRRIVESHGGTIQASGGTNGGTAFTVRLPQPVPNPQTAEAIADRSNEGW